MKTPPQLVWSAHGSPPIDTCEDVTGTCFVCCGHHTRGMLVSKWMGSNFTDQNRARYPSGTHVCEACVYVHSRTSPVLGRPPKDGKKYGGNFRNYCHMFDDRGYANASKGEKPLIREFLSRQHAGDWFAAIADSGQKHVLPFTPLNGPGRAGKVLFDEMLVRVPDDQSLVTELTDLLTAGCTKDEARSGEYNQSSWQRCADRILQFEQSRKAERNSPWFILALWLAQRDEEKVAARLAAEKEAKNAKRQRSRATARADSGAHARAEGASSSRGRKPAQTLDRDSGEAASGGPDLRERGGLRDQAVTGSPDNGPGQKRLPGFD